MEKFRQARASDRVPPPRNLFLRYNYMIATHVAFDAIMNILIAVNMIPIFLELSVPDTVWYMVHLKYINYVYCFVYIVEIIIKVSFISSVIYFPILV